MIGRLATALWFPPPDQAERGGPLDGLVAVGGDLSIDRLLLAYRTGLFPWTDPPLTWWSPDPRTVIELDTFRVPRSLRRVLNQQRFTVTEDHAFAEVMRGCAESAPGRESTWIRPRFIPAYTALHEAGFAHSVECWQADRLVGGIYGVSIGAFFAGESMFHRAPNASKVALCHLVDTLRHRQFALFDVQMATPITRRFGARDIPRSDYLRRLADAVARPTAWRRSQ